MASLKRGDASARLVLLVLIAASGASILSTDLYAPTLPHLPEYFGTDAATVQLTMALNLAAFAVALFVSVTPQGTAWPLAICVSGAGALLLVVGLLALRPAWNVTPVARARD